MVTADRRDADRRPSRHATARERVIVSGAVGVVVAGAVASIVPWQVSSLLFWDTAAVIFCAWVWLAVHGADAATTQRLATREDDSRAAADLVLVAASVASLLGVTARSPEIDADDRALVSTREGGRADEGDGLESR